MGNLVENFFNIIKSIKRMLLDEQGTMLDNVYEKISLNNQTNDPFDH